LSKWQDLQAISLDFTPLARRLSNHCTAESCRGSLPGSWKSQAIVDETRWDEKAGLRRDAVGSQVIDVLKAQIKETGNEEG
jgi:hypothetical protein